ncbi:Chymotrypsin-C [Trichinella pseudospiralis]|uniref:limulus clotting factor C n=1 Tax=Trichinella pseudospiralis TaxID=6337 RepID=A0A0V0XZ40_TRIPS|nr:Chymotrypsin-C [Trichinella pseudospiralis]
MISKHLKSIVHCISIFFLQLFQCTVESVPCGTSVNSPVLNGLYSLRIVRGSTVRPHSLPWQVLINIDSKSDDVEDTVCGGSLLKVQSEENSSNIVLTAAHCLYTNETLIDKSQITVVLGVHNRLIKESNQVVRQVADVKIHSGFSLNMLTYDIAILLLNESVEFNDYIRPVCIPSKTIYNERLLYNCIVSGWGRIAENAELSSVLQQAAVPIMSDKECFRSSNRILYSPITMLCAGKSYGSSDACQGDSGGPLICKAQTGQWVQFGITSFGIGCGRMLHPGIYTRVSVFYTWIDKTVSELKNGNYKVEKI